MPNYIIEIHQSRPENWRLNLPCPRCGGQKGEIHPGRGPHAAALKCADCGRFTKWVSKRELGNSEFSESVKKGGACGLRERQKSSAHAREEEYSEFSESVAIAREAKYPQFSQSIAHAREKVPKSQSPLGNGRLNCPRCSWSHPLVAVGGKMLRCGACGYRGQLGGEL